MRFTRRYIFFASMLLMLLSVGAGAQTQHAGQLKGKKKGKTSEPQPAGLDAQVKRKQMEREDAKLAFDKEMEEKKFEFNKNLEMQKLDVERDKSRWSAIATGIPLILGVLTLLAGVASQAWQAKSQFELKAATIAFVGKTPEAVFNRALALKRLFPDRLPDHFLDQFDPTLPGAGKEPTDFKKSVLQLLTQNADKRAEIIVTLEQLFPGDHEWIERLKQPPQSGVQAAPITGAQLSGSGTGKTVP